MKAIDKVALVPAALLLFCCFFLNSFASSQIVRFALSMLAVLVAVAVSFKRGTVYRWNWVAAVMLLFWAFAIFNDNHEIMSGDYSWVYFFSCALAVSLLLGCGHTYPMEGICKLIALFGVFFSVMTIAMWLYPPLFDFAKSVFFSDDLSARSYRSGFTAHYSTNGIYITFGVISLFSLALSENLRRKKLILLAGWATAVFALLLTTKRAHLVIAIAACLTMYIVAGRKQLSARMLRLVVGASVALIALSVASQYIPELSMTFDRIISLSDDNTFGNRTNLYAVAISLWEKSPLIGNGWGSFTEELYKTTTGSYYAAQGFFNMDSHNVFLQVMAEGGLLALSLFVICITSMLISTALHARRSAQNGRPSSAATFSWGVQLFFVTYCMTGNPLYDIQMYIPYLLVGFGGYLYCWNAERAQVHMVPPAPISHVVKTPIRRRRALLPDTQTIRKSRA